MGREFVWDSYRRSCNQAIRNLGVKHQTIDRKLKYDRVTDADLQALVLKSCR